MRQKYDGLAKRIKDTRQKCKLSQLQLARLTDLSNATICKIEHDKSAPHKYTINIIAEKLGVTPDYLKYGEVDD